jgi:hypothetical protein
MTSVTTALLGFLTAEPVGPLLAHQGGWDEMLMVAVPVIVFALLLRMASKRADRLEPADGDPPDGPTGDSAPTDAET